MEKKQAVCVNDASYERLFTIPCVTCVYREGDSIAVILNPSHTYGSYIRASAGDWLVEMLPGKWRRYSPEEYARLASLYERRGIK